ncbi:MAG: DUF3021 domain-containing protein [Lachnospiraceae bacterium]|nr:DUF3021 domain-containing protein [Lachnospiraceae bacterium]
MSGMKKSLFRRLLLGFVCGILIGIGFLLISKAQNHPMEDTGTGEIIKEMLFCGLYGSACLCAMILYKIDSLSLVLATGIHFLVVMAGLFLLGLGLGWAFDSTFVLYIFIAYILIFILSWSIMYLVGKSRVRRMNRDLYLWKSAVGTAKTGKDLT